MATKKQSERIQRQRKSMRKRKKAVSSVTPPPGTASAAPGGLFSKKDTTTMDDTITRIWNNCRQLLLSFRAGNPSSNTPAQDAAALQALAAQLESDARNIDTNRRTSPYNLQSLYQDQTNALISKTMYLAKKWITDGRPQVPVI